MSKKTNIDLTKVDEGLIESYLSDYGVVLDADATLEDKALALEEYTRKQIPKEHLADCDTCGGDSDITLPSCPYCGDGAVEGDIPETAEAARQQLNDDSGSYEEDEQGSADAPEQEESTVATKKRTAKKASKKPSKKQTKKAPSKKRSQAKKDDQESATEVVDGVLVEATGVEVVEAQVEAVRQLDDGIVEVKRLFIEGAQKVWELGRAIKHLHESELWKHRLTEDGKQAYKAWGAFVRTELHMSPTHAFSVMDVAEHFTEQQIAELGVAKLNIVLKLPDGERENMIERAKSGMSLSQVSNEVRDRIAKKGGKARSTGLLTPAQVARNRKGGVGKAKKSKAKKADGGEVTAVAQLGRTTVKLFAAPNATEKKEGLKVSKRRATTIAQDPSGAEELVNGVVVRYRIVKQAAGLALVIERRRESDE